MEPIEFDLLTFGQRLRAARKAQGMTLNDVGEAVGKPAPYLSLVENAKREPKLSLVHQLAKAVGTTTADLLATDPPSRRAELEIALEHAQRDPLYGSLGLKYLRPSAKLSDDALDHITTLFSELKTRTTVSAAAPEAARIANNLLRRELEARNNYLEEIEEVAADALKAAGYEGGGAVPQGMLTDLAAHFGFTVHLDSGVPESLQSISDLRNRRIFVPQRDTMRTRAARTVVLRTLGHFALGHGEATDFGMFLRNRVEANYFARAVLLPEQAAVPFLQKAKAEFDLSIEDLKEVFYVSYSMAAHRFANLVTRHLSIPIHYVRTDIAGTIWRGWANDGFVIPAPEDGTVIGQRLCQHLGGRTVFESDDRYSLFYQFVDTPTGTFFEVSHVLVDDRDHAVTIGTPFESSRWFRGHNTNTRAVSKCPDPKCCAAPDPVLASKWEGKVYASAYEEPQILAVSPAGALPEVDEMALYEFLESRDED
jgi:predicted transcriptional regulator/DNA-binding XRE family transcriptional regulator